MTAPGFPQPYPWHAPRPPSWWRRNRGPLVLLVIGLVLAVFSSSFALRTVRSAEPPSAELVMVDQRVDFTTTSLEKPVVIGMEFVSQKVTNKSQGYRAPQAGVMWVIQVRFTSVTPTDAAMSTCLVALVDSQGRRYGANLGLVGAGPSAALFRGCDVGYGKPTPWVKTWWFGVPDSVQITALYLSWDPPRIAVFPIAAP